MAELLPPIRLDMFTNYDPRKKDAPGAPIFDGFFGKPGRRIFAAVASGRLTDEMLLDPVLMAGKPSLAQGITEAERFFTERYPQIYGLPNGSNSDIWINDFLIRQQNTASEVIDYMIEKLPLLRDVLSLKIEVPRSHRATDIIFMLGTPNESETGRFEVNRQLLLSHISGMIGARNLGNPLETELNDIQRRINYNLFRDQDGERVAAAGRRGVFYTWHDNDTNRVVSPENQNSHLKRTDREVRYIPSIGDVYIEWRKKNDINSVLKTLYKAANNNGIINPYEDVLDGYGMMFALMTEEPSVDRLAEAVLGAVQQHKNYLTHYPDHKAGDDRGQSEQPFTKRWQVHFDHIPMPLELIFYTREDYINAEYEVGELDPSTGFYDGAAHELYELERISGISDYLVPNPVYHVNMRKAIQEQEEVKARELRSRGVEYRPKDPSNETRPIAI